MRIFRCRRGGNPCIIGPSCPHFPGLHPRICHEYSSLLSRSHNNTSVADSSCNHKCEVSASDPGLTRPSATRPGCQTVSKLARAIAIPDIRNHHPSGASSPNLPIYNHHNHNRFEEGIIPIKSHGRDGSPNHNLTGQHGRRRTRSPEDIHHPFCASSPFNVRYIPRLY